MNIGYLKGKVLNWDNGALLLLIPAAIENVGTGYQVTTPKSGSYQFLKGHDSVELFVHTSVRENCIELFGFLTLAEKDIFLLLLQVKGIGPKTAIGILSKCSPQQIGHAVFHQSETYFQKIGGMSKKTAHQILLDLKEVIKSKPHLIAENSAPPSPLFSENWDSLPTNHLSLNLLEDAKLALTGLGYKEREATLMINDALKKNQFPETTGVADLVRSILQRPHSNP